MNTKMTIELDEGDIFAWEQQWVEVKERIAHNPASKHVRAHVDLVLVPLNFGEGGGIHGGPLPGEPFDESIPDTVEHEVQKVLYVVSVRSNLEQGHDIPLVTEDHDEALQLAREIDGFVTTTLAEKPWENFMEKA
jgi:hypothetical protein